MTIYGYVRVSTKHQSTKRQIENIKSKYPEAIIFKDNFTGTTMERPSWNVLMKRIQENDRIVFDDVSRMARNSKEGFETYKSLYDKNIELEFIKEPSLNTEHFRNVFQCAMTGRDEDIILEALNRYLMKLAERQVISAFEQAQKEVDMLHERIKEGIRNSNKKSGIPKGTKLTTKKSIEAKELILKHSKNFGGSLNDIELMKMLGISKPTYYKYKRELAQ